MIVCVTASVFFLHRIDLVSLFFEDTGRPVVAKTYSILNEDGQAKIRDRRGINLSYEKSDGTQYRGDGELHDSVFVPILDAVRASSTQYGEETILAIDYDLQMQVYAGLEKIAKDYGYAGGAGVIIDIETGEVLTLVSYGKDSDESLSSNRAVQGLYVPGSVLKPFVAIAALSEGIISPTKEILSTGSIRLQNLSRGGAPFVFHDWKVHGYVDMREAIGVSSNVYFYTIGGGYGDQEGLGIERLERYLRMFGFGERTGIDFFREDEGTIPNPEWKAEKYHGDMWSVGDTYLASIGQHEYGVTPLQLARATAALGNGGVLVTPTLLRGKETERIAVPIREEDLKIVQEGMEYAVERGTASGLYMDRFSIAAKTGTAEVGGEKQFINSWIIGYFPQTDPKYAFTFLLAEGPWGEEVGAVATALDVLSWVHEHRQEYSL